MSLEIERKFVLRGEINESVLRIPGLPPVHLREGEDIIQGYLPVELLDELLVEFPTLPNKFDPAEIRLRKKGADYFLAMKGEGGLVREEYEIEVDEASFEHYWDYTNGHRIKKTRVEVLFEGRTLEVDFFLDRELVLGEVEFPSYEESEHFSMPGTEVTDDPEYKNKNLAK